MSESKHAFDLIFETLDILIFTNRNVARPGVVIANQPADFIASMHTFLPNMPLQFCDWHYTENIRKQLAKSGRKKAEREMVMERAWRLSQPLRRRKRSLRARI
jgi:hypothetical protein